MPLRRFARSGVSRYAVAALAVDAARDLLGGRRRAALWTLGLAALAYRWSTAGLALELVRWLSRHRSG